MRQANRGRRPDPQLVGRALAMMDGGQSGEDVAAALGVPSRTVYGWRQKYGEMPPSAGQRRELVGEHREEEKTAMRADFVRLVSLGTKHVIAALEEGRMAPRDAAWAVGVSFDKVRLLDNEPTAITADAPLADYLAGQGYEGARLRVLNGKRTGRAGDGSASGAAG